VVALDYPPECKGTFAVRLARRRPKPRAVKAGAQPAEPVADAPRTSTRLAHTLVTRETQFRQVAARRWFVIVDGVLQDPQDETTVARCLETRDVRVARGRTMRTEIVLRPTHCRVELRILWEGKPIGQAQIGLRSDPSSLRFSRDGVRHFALEPGFHGVRIGARDRVVERQIEVASFRPLQLAVDLVSEAGLVFSGCPSAVSPYLTGDLVGAAQRRTPCVAAGARGRGHAFRSRRRLPGRCEAIRRAGSDVARCDALSAGGRHHAGGRAPPRSR
jgi:hypothetical protein